MKTSEIKPNTLIQFNYKKSHPKEDRLFYVTKVEPTTITGYEFSYMGNSTKKFLVAHILNLELVPSAKLPIEAANYANEIFAKILDVNSEDITYEEIHGELIGYVNPKPQAISCIMRPFSNCLDFNYGDKEVRLYLKGNCLAISAVEDLEGNQFKTPQELAQYILTRLS